MKIHSTNIEEAFYSRKGQFLVIVFKDGATYMYEDVPLSVWEEFKASNKEGSNLTRGQYFYYNIRMEYAYIKIKSKPDPLVTGFEALKKEKVA